MMRTVDCIISLISNHHVPVSHGNPSVGRVMLEMPAPDDTSRLQAIKTNEDLVPQHSDQSTERQWHVMKYFANS